MTTGTTSLTSQFPGCGGDDVFIATLLDSLRCRLRRLPSGQSRRFPGYRCAGYGRSRLRRSRCSLARLLECGWHPARRRGSRASGLGRGGLASPDNGPAQSLRQPASAVDLTDGRRRGLEHHLHSGATETTDHRSEVYCWPWRPSRQQPIIPIIEGGAARLFESVLRQQALHWPNSHSVPRRWVGPLKKNEDGSPRPEIWCSACDLALRSKRVPAPLLASASIRRSGRASSSALDSRPAGSLGMRISGLPIVAKGPGVRQEFAALRRCSSVRRRSRHP